MELNTINKSGDLEALKITGADGIHSIEITDKAPYDDMQVDVSSVRLPASSAPTWRYWNYGIAGGIEFPVLGFAVGEYIFFNVQTSHQMLLNSVLDNHIHYSTPTDSTGKKFKFQLDAICAGIGETWATVSASPFTSEVTMLTNISGKHGYEDVADMGGCNTTVSTIYKCRLTRIAASADEYSGEIYIDFTDCHYRKDTLGSRTEGVK